MNISKAVQEKLYRGGSIVSLESVKSAFGHVLKLSSKQSLEIYHVLLCVDLFLSAAVAPETSSEVSAYAYSSAGDLYKFVSRHRSHARYVGNLSCKAPDSGVFLLHKKYGISILPVNSHETCQAVHTISWYV